MNARQKAKYYKKKYEELLHKRSNNFVPSFSSKPLINPSMLSYTIGECHFSKPYSSVEETFKPCQTMEEKK